MEKRHNKGLLRKPENVLRHNVDVAQEIVKLLQYTPYIAQIILKPNQTFVKVGDEKTKKAVTVEIGKHRKDTNNWLQDKWVVVKLTTRLIMNLKRNK